jgi:type IV fimbrial biogenesis protein FimT
MKSRTSSGFSLLELMITIIVGAILAALALPSFRTYFIRSSIAQTSNGLLAAMNTARAEAIKRNAYVRVDPTTCATTSWSCGAFVWLPAPTNPADTAPTALGDSRIISGEVVAEGNAINNGQKVTITVTSGAGDVVCYNGSGRMNLNVAASACATSAAAAPIQVKICDAQNVVKTGAELDVALSGRASIQPNVTCP